jgi:hypothetical protein
MRSIGYTITKLPKLTDEMIGSLRIASPLKSIAFQIELAGIDRREEEAALAPLPQLRGASVLRSGARISRRRIVRSKPPMASASIVPGGAIRARFVEHCFGDHWSPAMDATGFVFP